MGSSDPLHILHVLECFSGGSREIVRLLASHQAERGHSVSVLCGIDSEIQSDYAEDFHPAVRFFPVQGWGDRRVLSSVRAVFALRKKVARCEPDVVHLHSSIAGFVGRIALSFRKRSTLVYTPHGISLQRYGASNVSRFVYGMAEHVANTLHPAVYVACSRSEERVISNWSSSVQLDQIDNGIERISRAPSGEKTHSAPWQFVSVGRLCVGKNQIELIELKSRLNVDITVIGDGDDDIKVALIDAGIAVSGWLGREDLIKHLSRPGLILLQPSLSEGMPVSVLEAFSLQMPVIARHCPGHVNVIESGRNGMLYSSVDELVALVSQVISGAHRPEKLASVAHADFLERYTAELMGDAYLRCYRRHGAN